jgi:hypothetical protein
MSHSGVAGSKFRLRTRLSSMMFGVFFLSSSRQMLGYYLKLHHYLPYHFFTIIHYQHKLLSTETAFQWLQRTIFLGCKNGRGVKMATYHQLVSISRISRAIIPPHHIPSRCAQTLLYLSLWATLMEWTQNSEVLSWLWVPCGLKR